MSAWYVLSRTKTGKIIQAASMDSQMVGCWGVNVYTGHEPRVRGGNRIGRPSGSHGRPIENSCPRHGVEVIIDSLIVVVIGGLGNFWGALFAALLIGEVNAFGILWMPQWASILSFAS